MGAAVRSAAPPRQDSLEARLQALPAWRDTIEAIAAGFSADEHVEAVAQGLREQGIEDARDIVIGLATARVDRDREPRRALLQHAHQLLFARERVAQPYPVDALGPLAEAAKAIAQQQQCDPAIAGQSVLGAAALLAQRRVNAQTLAGERPAALYLLTVAGSGDGKDSADRIALARVRNYQKLLAKSHGQAVEAYEAQARSGEKKADPPPPPAYPLAADATVEGLRRDFARGAVAMMLASTEAATVLAGYGFSAEQRTRTAGVLTDMFDRGLLSVSRATAGRTERHGIRLSAHLLVQPTAAVDVLTDETLASMGFWPRWLLAWPADASPRTYRRAEADKDPAVRRFWNRCDELLARPLPQDCDELPALPLSCAAERVLAEAFELFEREGRRGELRAVKPFALRATELACRVAAVLAHWNGNDDVRAEIAQGAIKLVEHSLVNWGAAFAGRADPQAADAFALMKWLLNQPRPVRTKDVLRFGPVRLRSASRRDDAIERLVSLGLVEQEGGCLRAAEAR